MKIYTKIVMATGLWKGPRPGERGRPPGAHRRRKENDHTRKRNNTKDENWRIVCAHVVCHDVTNTRDGKAAETIKFKRTPP